MSGVTLHIWSDYDRLRIECANDEAAVWIRGQNTTVSLSLSVKDRAALRQALDAADAHDLKEAA